MILVILLYFNYQLLLLMLFFNLLFLIILLYFLKIYYKLIIIILQFDFGCLFGLYLMVMLFTLLHVVISSHQAGRIICSFYGNLEACFLYCSIKLLTFFSIIVIFMICRYCLKVKI